MIDKALVMIDYTRAMVYHMARPEYGLTLNKVQGIQDNLIVLANWCRTNGYLIVHVGSTEWIEQNLPGNINRLYEHNPDAQMYCYGDDEFLIPVHQSDYTLYKNTYSAFSGTHGELELILVSNNITQVVVCGIHSTGCVNNTIAQGFAMGFDFVMIHDCMETFDDPSKQLYQKILFTEWNYMYGSVVSLQEFKNEYQL